MHRGSQTTNCIDWKLSWTSWRADHRIQKKLCWMSTITPWYSCVGNSIKIKLYQSQQSDPGMNDHYGCSQIVQAAKFRRLENHPVHKRMSVPQKCRLKRMSFLSRWFSRRGYQEWKCQRNPLSIMGQPSSKPFQQESSWQIIRLKQMHCKQQPSCS